MNNKTIEQLEQELGQVSATDLRHRLAKIVPNNDVLWPMLASLAASNFSNLQPDFAVEAAARRLLVCIIAAKQYAIRKQWNTTI